MSEPKFTPGPWKILDSRKMTDEEYDRFVLSQDHATLETIWNGRVVIAEACAWNDEISERLLTANAHLIAAAPELYGVLEYVRDVLGPHDGWADDSKRMIEAALAKARGEG